MCVCVCVCVCVSPLDCKEIKSVHPKGNQSWIFNGRTDTEAETPILWPPDVKNWLLGKDPDAGKDWRQEEKGTTEDEMVRWHLWLNGHESEQALGVGDGQGSLECYTPWGRKESDTTERLNWPLCVCMCVHKSSLDKCIIKYFDSLQWFTGLDSSLWYKYQAKRKGYVYTVKKHRKDLSVR